MSKRRIYSDQNISIFQLSEVGHDQEKAVYEIPTRRRFPP